VIVSLSVMRITWCAVLKTGFGYSEFMSSFNVMWKSAMRFLEKAGNRALAAPAIQP